MDSHKKGATLCERLERFERGFKQVVDGDPATLWSMCQTNLKWFGQSIIRKVSFIL